MHRAIAAWLTERPWRAAFASAVCGALSPQVFSPFPVLACAIPVLLMLRFNATAAIVAAVSAIAAAGWVVLSSTALSQWVFVGMLCVFAAAPALAAVLKRTGSLNLTFQLAILGTALAVTAVHVLHPDPVSIWAPLITPSLDAMVNAGMQLESDKQAIVQLLSRTMWGAVAGMGLATMLGGVFLGRWWQSLLSIPGSFGNEYRELRFGLVLGTGVSALFLIGLVVDSALVSSLLWVAFVGLAFQGLAAAHRSKARGSMNRGWLAAIYVLLIVPLSTSITVVVLALWGFADNWLRPRAQRA
jgi:hypothetical protein